MKKAKYIIISFIFLLFSGLIIYFAIPIPGFSTINMAGSSAVSPLATKLASPYKDADVVVQAGGSGLGIDVALNNKKDIGMASKNPFSDFPNVPRPDSDMQKWIDRDMKTITIAWDGMGLVYKNPIGIDSNFKLDVNIDTLFHIYLAFAGYKDVEWSKLTNNENIKTKITPFARDGGSKKSGTAEAFFKSSGIKWDSLANPDDVSIIKKVLDNGNYGKNTIKTAEANSEAFNYFKAENIPGSIIYLSAGFIIQNRDIIKDSGFEIATYNKIELTKDKITLGYNWYRPLNLMISLKKTNNLNIKRFIEWILEKENPQLKIINDGGYIPLEISQINTMKFEDNLWVPDSILNYCGAKSG